MERIEDKYLKEKGNCILGFVIATQYGRLKLLTNEVWNEIGGTVD